jgi:hypothetical protein
MNIVANNASAQLILVMRHSFASILDKHSSRAELKVSFLAAYCFAQQLIVVYWLERWKRMMPSKTPIAALIYPIRMRITIPMRRITPLIFAVLYLSARIILAAEKEATNDFKETLSLLGITFEVESVSTNDGQELVIRPKGLEVDNSVIRKPVEGRVTKAEIGDLNVDGSPEIYVCITLPGKDARGRGVAWSANKKKSLSEIYLPELIAGTGHGLASTSAQLHNLLGVSSVSAFARS